MSDRLKRTGGEKLLADSYMEKLRRISTVVARNAGGRTRASQELFTAPKATAASDSSVLRSSRAKELQVTQNIPEPRPDFRLEDLLSRLFAGRDEASALNLLVDASQSMLYSGTDEESPTAGPTKFDYARKIAASLGYIALERGGSVRISGFAQNNGGRMPLLRGSGATGELLDYLEKLRAGGNTDYAPALRNFTARAPHGGVCIVLSDFYDPNWRKSINALISRRIHIVLLQIVTPKELEPDILGELRLVNTGTGAARELESSIAVGSRHKLAMDTFCGRLRDDAIANGMDYLLVTTDTPAEERLLKTLHRAGLLRG